MKKILLAALAASCTASLCAQSAVDAYNLSQTQSRGTARFMSMGGAFTALGGDLSTLAQNPAGIGVYRRSEIGATLDISPSKFTTDGAQKMSQNKTTVACNNFGYIGSVRLDGPMRTFNWGVSYSRVASFDRVFQAYVPSTAGSLSNYIAAYTTNSINPADPNGPVNPDNLDFGKDYNPYLNSDNDWLSILAYTSSMISPLRGGGYAGLYQNGTVGDALTTVREKGYVDEYNIDFGGNISDVVYWGIGFGITDLSYTRNAFYSESMDNARVSIGGDFHNGKANFDLHNSQHFSGSGWNFKAGVIIKPVNELRIGIAVHTPTWYSLSQSGVGATAYDYYTPDLPESEAVESDPSSFSNPLSGSKYTDDSYYNFHLNAPWRVMFGVAGVIANQAIISLDYEIQQYDAMRVKYQNDWGEFVSDDYVNDDIKSYYKGTNTLRLGAEYRVTPQFSLRAGYSYSTSNVTDAAKHGQTEIYTAGTNPAYTFNDDSYSVSAGLGYRISSFSIDAAYVYRNRKATWHAYTDYDGQLAPTAPLTQSTNSIVLSLAYRF